MDKVVGVIILSLLVLTLLVGLVQCAKDIAQLTSDFTYEENYE